MFRLQRLEITGFKSFADHTDLIFTGEGITAIVGPNGCGKSNVSDAIAWVLGEQRVKNLRGGEMKDVIFTGSRNRPPSGMAEVVLHMVRDETVEEEPDIEDIDATLEEIDDHAVTFEAPLLANGAAENVAQAEGGNALPEVQGEVAPSTVEISAAQTDATQDAHDAATQGADAAEATTTEALQTAAKKHGRRHWRPTRLALEFAPGETV
ncbi:MAG: AAA family ATPase, partial [Acidobacteria bacterium]|nr:AAA family ATPase [Acidobacteriota bacterium]